MGQDVDGFCAILRAGGHEVSTSSIPASAPRLADLSNAAQREALRVYRALGGKQPAPQLRPGSWDVLVDGVLVEFDEQLHFNRYRAFTLKSPLYEKLSRVPLEAYRGFCQDYEAICLKHGASQGRWMNPSTEGHFGPSAVRGDLSGNGSSRWKQRALYDFMKDVAPQQLPTARVAIWDRVPGAGELTVEAATNDAPDPDLAPGLWQLLSARIKLPS